MEALVQVASIGTQPNDIAHCYRGHHTLTKIKLNEPGNSTFIGLHRKCLVTSVKHRQWGNYLFIGQWCLVQCMAHIRNFSKGNTGRKIRQCMLLPSPGITLTVKERTGNLVEAPKQSARSRLGDVSGCVSLNWLADWTKRGFDHFRRFPNPQLQQKLDHRISSICFWSSTRTFLTKKMESITYFNATCDCYNLTQPWFANHKSTQWHAFLYTNMGLCPWHCILDWSIVTMV